jgi:hypothetical protein
MNSALSPTASCTRLPTLQRCLDCRAYRVVRGERGERIGSWQKAYAPCDHSRLEERALAAREDG